MQNHAGGDSVVLVGLKLPLPWTSTTWDLAEETTWCKTKLTHTKWLRTPGWGRLRSHPLFSSPDITVDSAWRGQLLLNEFLQLSGVWCILDFRISAGSVRRYVGYLKHLIKLPFFADADKVFCCNLWSSWTGAGLFAGLGIHFFACAILLSVETRHVGHCFVCRHSDC